jgi:signal transduction histidine kinase
MGGEQVTRLTRAYRALCECNATIAQATDEAELLSRVCSTLVETGGYRMAWIGAPSKDHRVTVCAQAGAAAGYLEQIQVDWSDTPHGQGPTGTAMRTGETSINRDSQTNPTYGPWREAALRHGYGSSIAVPLRHGKALLGVLTAYAAVPDAFDDEERALLECVGGALSHAMASLRTRVTLEVRDRQLRQSVKTEILSALAGGIVHDLNNSLMAISLTGDALQGHVDAIGRDLVREMLAVVTNASDLSRRVLAFARKAPVEMRPVHLGQTLKHSEPLLRRCLGPRVSLVTEVAPSLARVIANEADIEQLLLNLAINARDAISTKGDAGTLTIELQNVERAPEGAAPPRVLTAPLVAMSLRDTGTGMPADVLAQAFEPFFTTKASGTGLGLAMVFAIVDSHGGQITARSEPGSGTTFEVVLPAHQGA